VEQKGKVELFYELCKPKASIKYEKMVSLKGNSPEEIKLLETYIETSRKKSSKEALLLQLLVEENREFSLREINQRINRASQILNRLEKKGLVKTFYKEKLESPSEDEFGPAENSLWRNKKRFWRD
jgi:hypothetical protein